MISTGGSGLSTLKYGTSKENVVSLTVVTPNAEIIRTRQRVRKSSTGYDITQLYMGSEGTLGILTSITLRVYPKPSSRFGAFVSFANITAAANATVQFLHAQLPTLVRCECLNGDGIKATNLKFNTTLQEVPTLFLEFQSNEIELNMRNAQSAAGIAGKNGCLKWQVAEGNFRILSFPV